MLRILIKLPAETKTILVEAVPADCTIIFRPCAYCGKLVKAPRKTCCASHRSLLSLIDTKCQTKD
jgi:hypothetical protein